MSLYDNAPDDNDDLDDALLQDVAATIAEARTLIVWGWVTDFSTWDRPRLHAVVRWCKVALDIPGLPADIHFGCRKLLKRLGRLLAQTDWPATRDAQDQLLPDRQATWEQEYHHPQRPEAPAPPPRPKAPAPSAPFVAFVVCLRCEQHFSGHLPVRQMICPECGVAQLHHVVPWDLSTPPRPPFFHEEQ